MIMNRYSGKINIWNVVNEAFMDNGSWFNAGFYSILGEDYVRYAFEFAREVNPDCKLFYNDIKLTMEPRRNAVAEMIKKLQKTGIVVDGIGIQMHSHLGFPDIKELEKSILVFSELGCKINITEMEISVLPVYNPQEMDITTATKLLNPYKTGLPDKIAQMQNKRYKDFFKLFLKHSDKINSVTFWGINDNDSFKNNFPIPGRTDYPLLWDRNYQPKPVVEELIGIGRQVESN